MNLKQDGRKAVVRVSFNKRTCVAIRHGKAIHLRMEDSPPSMGDGIDNVASWERRLEMLAARVARIEAHVLGLEARLLFLRRALRLVTVMFLLTLVYAIIK
ncbi:hypothetical protein Patl1_07998 [Pistacia atlantica]|uniref:Uncharacterized protein n=1 Tax=Pistacia atlantica TaxID=434234 RepID=A0ACC1AGK1_9ROSI|nr:hypothetical protein Patl1_07998 [Pistacia atlantica]